VVLHAVKGRRACAEQHLLRTPGMTMTRSVTRWGGARLARRLGRSIPFLGTAIALVTVGAAIRRKGWVRGVADTSLTAVPLVGTAKTAVEVVRGRDIIPDRAARRS
jgi:hypothetical protein